MTPLLDGNVMVDVVAAMLSLKEKREKSANADSIGGQKLIKILTLDDTVTERWLLQQEQ